METCENSIRSNSDADAPIRAAKLFQAIQKITFNNYHEFQSCRFDVRNHSHVTSRFSEFIAKNVQFPHFPNSPCLFYKRSRDVMREWSPGGKWHFLKNSKTNASFDFFSYGENWKLAQFKFPFQSSRKKREELFAPNTKCFVQKNQSSEYVNFSLVDKT